MTNVIDIVTSKPYEDIADKDGSIPQLFEFWKKVARDQRFKTVLFVAITESHEIVYDIKSQDRTHLLQLYSYCDMIKGEINALLYPTEPEDETE